jgi:uncharacterized protein (DUF885 family)
LAFLATAWSAVAIRAAVRAKSLAVVFAERPSGQGKEHLFPNGVLQQQAALSIIPDFGLFFRNCALTGLGVRSFGAEYEVELTCEVLIDGVEAAGAEEFEFAGEGGAEADVVDDVAVAAMLFDQLGFALDGERAGLADVGGVVDCAFRKAFVQGDVFFVQMGRGDEHSLSVGLCGWRVKRWNLHRRFQRWFVQTISAGGFRLRTSAVLLSAVLLPILAVAQGTPDQAWIARSNAFTQMVLDAQLKYSPEQASSQGLAKADTEIGDPSRKAEIAQRKDEEAVVAKLEAALKVEKDLNVAEDLQIVIDSEKLGFRQQDYSFQHGVPYINAADAVYTGLQVLLDDQIPQARRESAVERLKKYAGVAPGTKPITEGYLERMKEQIAKPGVTYPSRASVETQLSRNAAIVDGIGELFRTYKLTGWEPAYAALKVQLADYDAWVRMNILPKTRTDFRLPAEQYALNFESYGIDIPPAQIAEMAHKAFADYQAQMVPIAAEIAKERGYKSSDYRDVIRELKKQQITGEAILPFYEKRLHEIEAIIVKDHLVTLPDRPAIIRLGTPAESSQQPAPHMVPPPFLHNTGERGVFVLPLNMPAGAGESAAAKVDDYTFDAAAWTLIAHEARPGHELQFDSMVEHGVSLARAMFAFNSTNAEGWGLYAEYITLPYMPKEGQLISLQFRLLRAARAFLDPELQSGKVTPADAMKVLTQDICFSVPFANQEVERYTFRSPGQANSYFYGYTRLLELRHETEQALGPKFNAMRFHDFLLAQGLLPPALMKKAVEEHFIPQEKART